MATREGFEPPTFGFGDQRSARLNYRAIIEFVCRCSMSKSNTEPGMEPGLLRASGTVTGVLGDSLLTYG